MRTPSPLARVWRILILVGLTLLVGISGITAARRRAALPAPESTPAPSPKPAPAKPAAAEPAPPPPSPEPQQAQSPGAVIPLTPAQNSPTNVITSFTGGFTRGQDYLRERDAWFYGQRAYPNAHIPTGARLGAIQQLDRMVQSQNQSGGLNISGAAFPLPGNQTKWTFLGPAPLNSLNTGGTASGRVTSIAVDPTNSQIVYIGTAEGGIWKTTNGGATWATTSDQAPSLAIGSITIDPSPASCSPGPCTTIYAGTGEDNFNADAYYGVGILKSTDGGTNWVQITGSSGSFVGPFSTGLGGTRIGAIAADPFTHDVGLLGVAYFDDGYPSGLYRSTTGSTSGGRVLPLASDTTHGAPATAVVFDPVTSGVAYAALGAPFGDPINGVYKSIDHGATWSNPNTGANKLPTTNVGRIALAIAPTSPTTLYAAIAHILDNTAQAGSLLGVFKTTDGGLNWTQLGNAPAFCTQQCWYDMAIAVRPDDANTVFVAGQARNDNNGFISRSTDGGTNWSTDVNVSGATLHADFHDLVISKPVSGNTTLYAANDGGIYSTTNPGAAPASMNWTSLNTATLGITQFYQIESHPVSGNILFGGTQDNGLLNYSGPVGSSTPPTLWNGVTCGDGGWTAIDPTNPSIVYVTCTTGNPPYIKKSFNNGQLGTFQGVVTGINAGDLSRTPFIPPLVMDQNNPLTLYTPSFRIYQTLDGANTWTAISPDLTGGGSASISTLAIQEGNSNEVVVGTSDGHIQLTTNATSGIGSTWTDITGTGLPNRFVTSVFVPKNLPNTVFATFSGFCGNNVNFSDTKGHVFMTTNANAGAGTVWTDISGSNFTCSPGVTDLPNVPVNDFFDDRILDQTNKTLYVATDVGVFNTTDGGAHWSAFNPGTTLPRVAVLSLGVRGNSLTATVGTHGRGSWFIQTPVPSVTGSYIGSIDPATINVEAGASPPPATLTIDGLNFVNGTTKILWNGSQTGVTTTFVSANQLTATIDGSLLTTAQIASIIQSDANGTTNGSYPFVVTNQIPSPTGLILTPAQPVAGASLLLDILGSGFVCGSAPSQVVFNGKKFNPDTGAGNCSATEIKATIPANQNLVAGTATATVFNPPPGGGTANGFFQFTINPAAGVDLAINKTHTGSFVQGQTGATYTLTATNAGSAATNGTTVTVTDTLPAGLTATAGTGTGWSTSTGFPTTSPVTFTRSDALGSAAGYPPITLTVNVAGNATTGTNTATVSGGGDTVNSNDTANDPTVVIPNGSNPVPTLTSISPTSGLVGQPINMTLTGTNFISASIVNFGANANMGGVVTNGGATLTITIPGNQLTTAGPVSVTVTNPTPGGGTTAAQTFTVNNPVPTIATISPTNATAGGAGITLTVNGTNFNSSSVVNFNGNARTTTFVNATQVTASITAADIAATGTFNVTVTNPTPGGGTSGNSTFSVNNPAPAITSLSPSSAIVGGTAFTLTVNGTGFVSGAMVNFNGNARPQTL